MEIITKVMRDNLRNFYYKRKKKEAYPVNFLYLKCSTTTLQTFEPSLQGLYLFKAGGSKIRENKFYTRTNVNKCGLCRQQKREQKISKGLVC